MGWSCCHALCQCGDPLGVERLQQRVLPPGRLKDARSQSERWLPRVVQNHAGVGGADADLLSQSGRRGLVHSPLSQIVSDLASPKCHRLGGALLFDPCDNLWMDDQAKNGGPNHLRAWRTFREMTLAELAEQIGTNPNVIGYLETGERALSAKWLRRLHRR